MTHLEQEAPESRARMSHSRRSKAVAPVCWSPQPGPQKALIDCPLTEILFGGARGGGKTDGILGKWGIKATRYGRGLNAVFFRKEMPQQDDLIERAKDIYGPTGAQWQEQKRQFLMPGGGRVRFRPLENVADAEKYQGQNLSDAAIEEAGNYPDSNPIDRLYGCLRSSMGAPVQMILSANPGGPGHTWIKARYIDPAPLGLQLLDRKLPNGKVHQYTYIPSRLENNAILLAQDPEYASRLYLVGSEQLVRAWLNGDWDVIEGAFFPEFSTKRHVIAPFEIPAYWARIRSMDWGSARPFAVGWYALSDGTVPGIPRGCMVKYREWYGWNGTANQGCKMTAQAVGQGIVALETDADGVREEIADAVLDPSAFATNGGPSIAEMMNVNFRPADNARIARAGALGGWDQLRMRLQGDDRGPGLLIFSTCVHTIRTVPALQHDKHKAEDVDSDGEDHAPDETRYGCMSRPYVQENPTPDPKKFEVDLTINELIKRQREKRIAAEY
jgi:hypothetical protein